MMFPIDEDDFSLEDIIKEFSSAPRENEEVFTFDAAGLEKDREPADGPEPESCEKADFAVKADDVNEPDEELFIEIKSAEDTVAGPEKTDEESGISESETTEPEAEKTEAASSEVTEPEAVQPEAAVCSTAEEADSNPENHEKRKKSSDSLSAPEYVAPDGPSEKKDGGIDEEVAEMVGRTFDEAKEYDRQATADLQAATLEEQRLRIMEEKSKEAAAFFAEERAAEEEYARIKAEKKAQKKKENEQKRAEAAEKIKKQLSKRKAISYDFLNVPFSDAQAGADHFSKKAGSLTLRALLTCVLTIIAVYLTAAPSLGLRVPFGFGINESPFIYYLVLFAIEIFCMLLSIEVTASGFWRLIVLRPTMDSLVFFAAAASLIHCGLVIFMPGIGAFLPYCSIACLLLTFSMFGKRSKAIGMKRIYRCVASSAGFKNIKVLDGGKIYIAVKNDDTDGPDISAFAVPDRTERVSSVFSPIIILACLILSAVAAIANKDPHRFFWALSAISAASASCTMILSSVMPWASASKRLFGSGAVMPDDRLAARLAACRFAAVYDSDIYPVGSVEIEKFDRGFGTVTVTEDTVIECSAALMSEIGGGISSAFEYFLRERNYEKRRAESIEYYETGGMSGNVGDHSVLVGTPSFLMRMGCRIPQIDDHDGAFVAIDREFAGVFKMRYIAQESVRSSFRILIHSKVKSALAVKNFCLNEMNVAMNFKLRKLDADMPALEQRLELMDSKTSENSPAVAYLNRDNFSNYAETIRTAKNMTLASRFNIICSLIASAFGIAIMYFLTYKMEPAAASPLNLFLYQILWLIPPAITSILTSG